jgi:hypothetical protein
LNHSNKETLNCSNLIVNKNKANKENVSKINNRETITVQSDLKKKLIPLNMNYDESLIKNDKNIAQKIFPKKCNFF